MDLADQIDEYICSFEGIGDITMDSLAIFVFIWAVVSLLLIWLGKFLYNKYMNKEVKPASNSNSRQNSVAPASKSDKQRLSEPRDILSTKSDDLLTKTQSSRGRDVPGTAASGSAIRRRVVRQSSTGPENRKKRYVPPPSNVVGPESTSVTWTSQVFRWLYSDLVIVNELLMTWVIALNETLRKSLEEHGVAVEIIRVLPDSPAPGISNIFCNSDENNPSEMVITFDCDAMPVMQVKAFRQKSGKVETSHYKVTVSRFRARMSTAINYNSIKGEMHVDGFPDIRIATNSVGAIKPMDQDEKQLQAILSEILSNALRDTVYPVDFSMYSTCPRAEIEPTEFPVIYPVHYDSLAQNMEKINSNLQSPHQQMISGRRLLVKIVKGEGLKDAKEPFVIIEMDEPAQKNQTGVQQGVNPYWDEHFLFELSPQSAEILFEVYDRSTIGTTESAKFLGLGLVGIDELAVGPASTQVLSLQPRPYETQTVHGAITIDFVFIEGAEVPVDPRPSKIKEALRISTPMINEHIRNGSDLADAAVRALQDGALTSNGNPSKSTLIIHSVQKVELNQDGKIEVKENDDQLHYNSTDSQQIYKTNESLSTSANMTNELDQMQYLNSLNTKQNKGLLTSLQASNEINNSTTGNGINLREDADNEFGEPNAASSPNSVHNNYNIYGTDNNHNGNYFTDRSNTLPRNNCAPISTGQDTNLDDRGRSKKRNFFGTLKKRLSKSKTRTHSADHDALTLNNNNATSPTGTLNGDSRSLSVDRAVMSKTNSLDLYLNEKFQSKGPRMGVPSALDNSRRSSISESSAISGFSSASTKTYIHEASTLVLETIENGIKRHFIVPLAIAQRPRWRRKGTKLHIYNDHTFIAKHLSGSGLQCAVCMKSIPRRPGKQGYECRDCYLICHKQCHVRAPQACPNPTILSMELTSMPVLTENDINFYN